MIYNLEELKFISNNTGNTFLVFVYCNLKKDFIFQDFLNKSEVEYLGEHTTKDKFIMYNMGKYPIVSDLDEGDGYVSGELYRVDNYTLVDLDKQNYLLRRKEIELSIGLKCYMYFISSRFNTKRISVNIENNLIWKGKSC